MPGSVAARCPGQRSEVGDPSLRFRKIRRNSLSTVDARDAPSSSSSAARSATLSCRRWGWRTTIWSVVSGTANWRGDDVAKRGAEVWFVYILRCADGTLYTGITKDVTRRIQQHNDGAASRYTRSRRLVKLVYQETQRSRSLALKREAAIKRLTRTQKLALIRERESL